MIKSLACAALICCLSAAAFAGNAPTPSKGRAFSSDDHIVSTIVFTWFDSDAGQKVGPWRPIGGRAGWDGSVEHWKGQLKQMMMANFDTLWVHLITNQGHNIATEKRANLFKAYAELRAEGYNPPTIAPFLDSLIIWGQYELKDKKPLDMTREEDKDKFVAPYIMFFEEYFAANTDPDADSFIQTIDGKVVLDIWHIHLCIDNINALEREDVEKRLKAKFGKEHPIFKSGIYFIGTSTSPTVKFADEKMTQFEKHAYYDANTTGGITDVQLKGGYWDQNVRNPGYIMPRDGGKNYIEAWRKIDRDKVDRIYVESWNEYDEGSGIYAAQTIEPYLNAETAAKRSDFWSASGDSFEYIKTTAKYSALFNDALAYNARVIGENIPRTMKRGESAKARITILNTGNVSWNASSGVRLACDNSLFVANTVGIDDSANEIGLYGGIFRGRPVTFDVSLKAPDKAGVYMLRFAMTDSDGARFGYGKSVEITVE